MSSAMSLAGSTPKKIRVLIVDDSASVRTTLSEIIAADPALEVMATASDPYVAVERIRHEVPDVMFLDLEMPRMDGLTFLRKMMAQRPIPTVICSSLTAEGSEALMQALELPVETGDGHRCELIARIPEAPRGRVLWLSRL